MSESKFNLKRKGRILAVWMNQIMDKSWLRIMAPTSTLTCLVYPCVPVVHGEDVLGHSPELHDDVLHVGVVDDLEVLDRCLGDAAVEVEDITLSLVIPHRRLVVNLNKKISFRVTSLVALI